MCGAWSAFEYQGQTCITASRHLVQRAVADAYIDAFAIAGIQQQPLTYPY